MHHCVGDDNGVGDDNSDGVGDDNSDGVGDDNGIGGDNSDGCDVIYLHTELLPLLRLLNVFLCSLFLKLFVFFC